MEDMTQVISMQSMTYMQLIIGFAVLFPIITACLWKFRKKAEWLPMIAGVCAYFAFAIIGRQITNLLFFGISEKVAQALSGSAFMAMTYIVLQAVILEETARLVCFKWILGDDRKKEVPISFGIGFGGLECMYVLGYAFLDYYMIALQTNNLGMEGLAELSGSEDSATLFTIIEEIQNIGVGDILLVSFERILYLIFQVSLSILVFSAIQYKEKSRCFPLAVLLHLGLQISLVVFSGRFWLPANQAVLLSVFVVFTAVTGFLAFRVHRQLPEY